MMIPFQVSISKGWLHEYGSFSFDQRYYLDPYHRYCVDHDIDMYLERTFIDIQVNNFESNLVQKDFIHPDLLRVGAIQPNLLLGKILGAELVFPEGADADIDRSPLRGVKSQDELPLVSNLAKHPLIHLLSSQTIEASEDCHFIVIPPFFWDRSGRATIHGILTTAHKLVGERFFLLMHDDPNLAHAVLSWITDAYQFLIHHFASLAKIDITSVHVGECSGCLVSLQDFESFAKQYIERFSQSWPVRVHSCGFSDHLIDALTTIRNLGSLDIGSYTSVELIRSRMGQDFLIEVAPPVEILLAGSSEDDCINWVHRTLAENGSGPMRITCHLEPGYSLDRIRLLADLLRS